MSDQPTIFQPFVPATGQPTEPVATPAKTSNKGSRRKASAAKAKPKKAAAKKTGRPKRAAPVKLDQIPPPAPTQTVVAASMPRVRKPRGPNVAKPRAVQVPIGILPHLAGLKPDDAKVLMGLIRSLQDVGKAGRRRVVAALGSVFA